jgi:hypothetical protein
VLRHSFQEIDSSLVSQFLKHDLTVLKGMIVTSHSGALRKLIIEDTCSQVIWTFLMLKHLYLIMMRYDRRHEVLLFDVDRCY